ncbi:hypothetical protein [Fodinibius sp. AD559]|uniref:hypothetical protein n=1 Tax=Fodinibius sp. AD559 TaxID=3424179 RepID=UPI00404703FF
MEIKFKGWTSQGFRCPDVEVDLTKEGSPAKINFIQMPNGTGKTTTLLLLKACLTGDTTNWSKADIKELKKKNHAVNEGRFTTNLLVDGKELSIELVADFRQGEVTFWTISPEDRGRKKGWVLSNQLARFLNEKFIKLFIFDGELAEKLLENDENEASKAIDALFQLYLLDEIKERLNEYWDQKTEDVPRKSKQAITQQKKKLKELEEREEKLTTKFKRFKNRIEENEEEYEKNEKEIERRITKVEKFREEFNDAKAKLGKLQGKITSRCQQAFQLLRNPASIHEVITNTLIENKGKLDKLKLPANTSRQFFEELANQDQCICGNDINEQEEKNIREQAEQYLSNEISGFLNSFKTEVESLQSDGFDQASLQNELSELSDLLDDRDRLEGKIRHIKTQLEERGDDKLKDLQDRQAELNKENKDLGKLIKAFKSDNDDNPYTTKNISVIKKEIENIENEIEIISGKVELKEKIDLLKEILTQSKLLAKEKLKQQLLDKFKNRIDNILKHNPISIESIDGNIKLVNQSGASVGQTLGIAYCFLTTLLRWGTHSFPLVVDSPAGSLDINVRRHIARIIPDLTDQFIAFTISSERKGFVNEMKKGNGTSIKSLTVLRKTGYSKNVVDELNPQIAFESTDGFVIDDEDFFNQIDIEEEES